MGLNIDLNFDNCEEDITPNVGENMMGGEEHVDKGDCGIKDSANDLGMGLTSKDDQNLEPYNGMEFDSHEEAYSFYLKYAKFLGFAVSRKASRRSKISDKLIDAKFSCTRYGTKRESNAINPRPCLKIDCQATLHVKRRQDCGKWFVQNFIKEHNHELFPNEAHYFPCHRKITSINKHNIDTLHAVRVGTSKIFAAMAKQCGGYQNVGFLQKDIRNHLDKERRLALESGDAKAMLEHFMLMQEENPNFFYAIDLDEEQRLKNVFWVDAKGRENSKNFGDVVSFDTTYITNKYKMPFAPFIGVNNHFQSTLLGCALLADETTSTFVWLMQTWTRAMGGRAPTAILTDQDKAMKAAITMVFPNARHRFCLWHILSKIPEKLGNVLKKHENFMGVFNKCIYNSWTEEDFEKRWWNMVEIFELEGNEWVESLFEDRKQWVPTYMRDTFFAGMSTTQRSESINSFFDKYVNRKTTLKEFVEQYKVALLDRQEEEAHADFNTWHKKPAVKSPSPFEQGNKKKYNNKPRNGNANSRDMTFDNFDNTSGCMLAR
ncbi:hypothetical protein L1049_017383 [Liquidambar formosana]|uniref:Protein FAR1-RELATED SEQUENCE n=1 Tax=Liquidambar formosana TaxID=63359 RepID=A0AAP0S3S3_LIQFO